MTTYEKTPGLCVGDELLHYDDGSDGHPTKWVIGRITEVGEDSFEIQWDDLEEPTEYERSKVEIINGRLYEEHERAEQIKFKNALDNMKNL